MRLKISVHYIRAYRNPKTYTAFQRAGEGVQEFRERVQEKLGLPPGNNYTWFEEMWFDGRPDSGPVGPDCLGRKYTKSRVGSDKQLPGRWYYRKRKLVRDDGAPTS